MGFGSFFFENKSQRFWEKKGDTRNNLVREKGAEKGAENIWSPKNNKLARKTNIEERLSIGSQVIGEVTVAGARRLGDRYCNSWLV